MSDTPQQPPADAPGSDDSDSEVQAPTVFTPPPGEGRAEAGVDPHGKTVFTPPPGEVSPDESTKTVPPAVPPTTLEALGAHQDMDVAVFTGVQVHLPDDVDHIWPSSATIQGADGRRVPVEL